MSRILAGALKRDRAIVALGLAGIITLSWTYLIWIDWGMRQLDIGMEMVVMPAMQNWTAWDLVLVFLMWAVQRLMGGAQRQLLVALHGSLEPQIEPCSRQPI